MDFEKYPRDLFHIHSIFQPGQSEEHEQNDFEVSISDLKLTVRCAEDDFNVEKKTLFATFIWNGATVLSNYLVENMKERIHGHSVLELGAGAGVPSIICHNLSASLVCASDYPSNSVISNLIHNVNINCICSKSHEGEIVVVPYGWGNPPDELISVNYGDNYDVVIASECLWHHVQHAILLQTVTNVIREGGCFLLSFSHHIPGLEASDLQFFELAREVGFDVVKQTSVMSTSMWSGKPTDIFIYELLYRGGGGGGEQVSFKDPEC